MGSRSFRNLAAYRQAVRLANDVRVEVLRWGSFDGWSAGIQLVRAVDSIGADIAEATGRWHGPDRRRLLFIARGSLHETEHWLSQARCRDLIDRGYEARLSELARTLNGMINRTTDGVLGP